MDYRRRLDVNVKDKDLEGVSVGDEVTIHVTGIVKELRLGDTPEKKRESEDSCCCGIPYSSPSQICIEMDKQIVEHGKSQFEAMLQSEEEDY